LDHFKKSPKMEPKFWAPFLKKKIAQALEKSPKWRFFAQSGHTDSNFPIVKFAELIKF